MPKLIKRISRTIGLAPGTLVHVGEERSEKVKITIIDYNKEHFEKKEVFTVEECYKFKDTATVSWINVDGIHDLSIIEKIGNCYSLHPLILEDIVDTGQRPKFEDSDKYLFVVTKMFFFPDKEIKSEQLSLILGPNYLISFQEQEGDVFNLIRERIRNDKGKIRKMGVDYLAYALLDAVVDSYFLVLEKLGEQIEVIEEELITDPTPRILQTIQRLKRDTIFLRKSTWPLREVISNLDRSESDLIHKSTKVYLRDVYDHTIQIIDTIESFRDMVSGMLDIYLSSISNKMNEVMKVLTIIATIFIPITFIVGIYGMNFNPEASRFNMPELNWPFGYIFVWGVILVVVFIMLVYFKRKKWL